MFRQDFIGIFEILFDVGFDGGAVGDGGARFRDGFGVFVNCGLQFGEFRVRDAVIGERGFVFHAEIVNRLASGGEFAVFDAAQVAFRKINRLFQHEISVFRGVSENLSGDDRGGLADAFLVVLFVRRESGDDRARRRRGGVDLRDD